MASDASKTAPSQNQSAAKSAQEKRKGAGSTSEKPQDAKTVRRLAQNREAARKSCLRKKAYVQQLESSRLKLNQLEQYLQRARSQGLFLGCGDAGGNISSVSILGDISPFLLSFTSVSLSRFAGDISSLSLGLLELATTKKKMRERETLVPLFLGSAGERQQQRKRKKRERKMEGKEERKEKGSKQRKENKEKWMKTKLHVSYGGKVPEISTEV